MVFEGRICNLQEIALEPTHILGSPLNCRHQRKGVHDLPTHTHPLVRISLQKRLTQFADRGLERRGAATAIQGDMQLPSPLKPPCQIQPAERSLSAAVHANEWLRCRLHAIAANASAPLVCMMSHVCKAAARMSAQHLIAMRTVKARRETTDYSRRSIGPSRYIVPSVSQPLWA